MEDVFDCWVDSAGAVLTRLGQGMSALKDGDPVLDAGFTHLSWNEDGVTVRYCADRVYAGALRGAIRQIRLVKRPVQVHRHVAGNWEINELASGSAAAEALRSHTGRPD